jgi:hypothetical protein
LPNCRVSVPTESAAGPLLELVTDDLDDRADPRQATLDFIGQGGRPILHHNHLSQESLSFADWNGACDYFDEVFAHCADGTLYWGRVLDRPKVKALLDRAVAIETDAMNDLFQILLNAGEAEASELSTFFRKEVANRAMALIDAVE